MEKTNQVICFLIYINGKWDEEECRLVFGQDRGKEIWNDWCEWTNFHETIGAIPYFFLDLSLEEQNLLVDTAVKYNGERTE